MTDESEYKTFRLRYDVEVHVTDVQAAAAYALRVGEDREGNMVPLSHRTEGEAVCRAVGEIISDAINTHQNDIGGNGGWGMQSSVLEEPPSE